MKAFVAALAVILAVMAADPKSCDKPAGSDQGGSAGNNQPNYKADQCAVPQKVKKIAVAYVQQDGLKYSASAYIMEGDCDSIDTDDEKLLKVTLAAFDSIGRRLPPVLDSSPQASPFGAYINIPLPTSFRIDLAVTGNMNREQVKATGAVFIGCALIPADSTKDPLSIKVFDIGGGRGKAECKVAR